MNKVTNPVLKPYAQRLRRDMTKEERHLWYDFLKSLPVTTKRQMVIGSYIVDFYIASAKLVIELDGSQHYEEQGVISNQERDSFLSKAAKQRAVRTGRNHTVRVDTQYFCSRETTVKLFFYFLCTGSDKAEFSTAVRTASVKQPAESTIMTNEAAGVSMPCHSNATVRTAIYVAAERTGHQLAGSTPVQEQDALLSSIHAFLYRINKRSAEISEIPVFEFLLHVNYCHPGKRFSVIPVRKMIIIVISFFCQITASEIRGCRTQQQKRVFLQTSKTGNLSGMVAR